MSPSGPLGFESGQEQPGLCVLLCGCSGAGLGGRKGLLAAAMGWAGQAGQGQAPEVQQGQRQGLHLDPNTTRAWENGWRAALRRIWGAWVDKKLSMPWLS